MSASVFTLVTIMAETNKGVQTLATFMSVPAILAAIFAFNTAFVIRRHNL